jgi:hypothetical protein
MPAGPLFCGDNAGTDSRSLSGRIPDKSSYTSPYSGLSGIPFQRLLIARHKKISTPLQFITIPGSQIFLNDLFMIKGVIAVQ